MSTVTLWAPAKLTLSLRVTGVRDDGYHLIDAEMVTLDLADRLELDPDGDAVRMVDGSPPPGGEDDLVWRALRLADRRAEVVIDKVVPPGAGLGGGSADAAAVLRWAGCTDLVAAAAIGADVAFCVVGGRARVQGIGEIVEPLTHEERVLTLATPPFGCSTPAVYAAWDRLGGPRGTHGNDLEAAAIEVEPRLADVRETLGELTGQRPRLAGSGSTWFVEGAFPGEGRRVVHTTPAGWAPAGWVPPS
jgi:4-diphosphocytidyl-2-C-methyl-D-erythritol kinase